MPRAGPGGLILGRFVASSGSGGHSAQSTGFGPGSLGSAAVLFLVIYVSWLLSLSERHENEVPMANRLSCYEDYSH